jgi:hypothetical protein
MLHFAYANWQMNMIGGADDGCNMRIGFSCPMEPPKEPFAIDGSAMSVKCDVHFQHQSTWAANCSRFVIDYFMICNCVITSRVIPYKVGIIAPALVDLERDQSP